ncbi:MAG: hypothetical protein JWM10_4765, partial [Myxococcaceae bacterium]|nr:hypothetical protein [Myxococcaceae bacterium]
PRADRVERAAVVIVGGGVAGLSAAWRLARAGLDDVALLEIDPVLGGTARAGSSALGGHPWGAHYITTPMRENAALLSLLDEAGVLEGRTADGDPIVAEAQLCRDPAERVFTDGRWRAGLYQHDGASARDLDELRRFQAEVDRWVAWRDGRGRRAFTIPSARCSDDPEVMALDRVSIAQWLDARGLRSPRLRWLIDYACRDDYGCTLDDTSAWAALFYFAARQRAPGAEAQAVITWPEGNGRLVAHLRSAMRARVRTDAAVIDVAPAAREGGRPGVDVLAVGRDGALRVEADRVIFAAPQFIAARVLRAYREQAPAHLAAFAYGAWMVAHLSLRARPRERGFPAAWDNVLRASPSLGYVVNSHQRLVDHGPTDWSYYYPLCEAPAAARRRLLSLDRARWADVALSDLERAHPGLRGLVERVDVMRWGHAMVRPTPGLRSSEHRRAAMQPRDGVHFAHSDLSAMALFEESFDHGVRAAEEVLAARGVAHASLR